MKRRLSYAKLTREILAGWLGEFAAGKAQGRGWVAQVNQMSKQMARIVVEPEWVGILDFEQRFPSAIEKAMAGMASASAA